MPPKAFVSYSWDDAAHEKWVEDLAGRLRQDGVETILDKWHVSLGKTLPEFMERGVRENEFVVVVCTPAYKKKADERLSGVGYENDLMTGEKFADGKREKFIPVLRVGSWSDSVPSWLKGVLGVNLSGDPYSQSEYTRLLAHLHRQIPAAPPVGKMPNLSSVTNSPSGTPANQSVGGSQNIYNHGNIGNQVNIQSGTVHIQLPTPDRDK